MRRDKALALHRCRQFWKNFLLSNSAWYEPLAAPSVAIYLTTGPKKQGSIA
jgi:hypothetical protein